MEEYKSNVQSLGNTNIDFRQIYSDIRRGFYKYLGVGSGRVVFDLENGNVVKVALNRRGIAQNEAEYKIALTNDSHLFAKIFQAIRKI